MYEVTWPKNAVRAATGGPQGFGASDVFCNKRRLLWRIWPRRLTYAVTAPNVDKEKKKKTNQKWSDTNHQYGSCMLFLAAPRYLKVLLFRVPSSTTSVLSRTASDGEDSRIREVAGTPSWFLGDPSLSRSKCCLTGSYSISSCSVWLVRWISSST